MSTNRAALPLALAMLIASGFGVSAAPAAEAGVTRVAEATNAVRPVAATEAEEEPGTCSRLRRRLFVEGEGWIVRRITTCR